MANPFLTPSTLPYELPAFADIRAEDYLPALEAGFAQQLAEIEDIAANPEPASFANTVVALERSGRTLQRVAAVLRNIASADATEEILQLEQAVAPRLAAHQDNVYLHPELYGRVMAVDEGAEGLAGEDLRLVSELRKQFRRAGAGLEPGGQERLREMNVRLSELSTEYSQELLAAGNAAALHVADRALLDGLAEEDITATAQAAREAGYDTGWLLTLVLPTAQPALEVLTDRDTRRRLFQASVGRGGNGNRTVLLAARLAELRAERAALLGYPNHAEYALESQTAPSLEAVRQLLAQLVPPAVGNARAEARVLAAAAGHEIEPWDWPFYSEQVRRRDYDVDLAKLRPYFELESVLHGGVFHAAEQLYGLSFEARPDLQGYHPDIRVWEVKNDGGMGLGLFLGDYYARPTKNGGAWMDSFVEQSGLLGQQAVVVNNLNITKPAPGEPTLLTFDQVVTLFHEFGHALHGLFSQVRYPRFSGTSVPRDFVEYPSQVNEMWMLWPQIVADYASEHVTGAALPPETVDKIEAARLWGEGFATTEYLAATLLDLAWHSLPAGTLIDDPLSFEKEALKDAGLDLDLIPPRYRSGYFKHIFAGGYAAGYYSYLWSEVLDADTVLWFGENGGLNRDNGDHFRTELLSRGNSIDPLQAFRNFRGRDAEIGPLLARRGLDGNNPVGQRR
ncbi:M3 family metallopeptidase [Crystallibacter degradans]|uniref:M3 family metallopeptidase n=1 Tax=Crystallibacter degradans TaxID=2726743 RepID=UPI001472FE57|nr:M3 family metallopeptidase [Arthrobacter sp. SF27]NMR31827.1 M3 family metallopeptidase [Arthrobacter sp. SF27]